MTTSFDIRRLYPVQMNCFGIDHSTEFFKSGKIKRYCDISSGTTTKSEKFTELEKNTWFRFSMLFSIKISKVVIGCLIGWSAGSSGWYQATTLSSYSMRALIFSLAATHYPVFGLLQILRARFRSFSLAGLASCVSGVERKLREPADDGGSPSRGPPSGTQRLMWHFTRSLPPTCPPAHRSEQFFPDQTPPLASQTVSAPKPYPIIQLTLSHRNWTDYFTNEERKSKTW